MFDSKFIRKSKFVPIHDLKDIVILGCDYTDIAFKKEMFVTYGIDLPYSLSNAVKKRQAEFLAGRITAISTLHDLGVSISNIPIGKHRSPLWPEGVVASITHSNGIALCAAAYKVDYNYLGVDLECWIAKETVQQIKYSIITPSEEYLLKQCPLSFNKAFTLTFSAKESLFKALYPRVGYYFDFFAVEIISLCIKSNCFVLELRQELSTELNKGCRFIGHIIFDGDFVQTLVVK